MIDQWIESVCSGAGWDRPFKSRDSRYRFRLESGWVVDASPGADDRTLVLEAKVRTLAPHDSDFLLKKTAGAVVPRTFKDSATISYDSGSKTLYLHRVVALGALRASEFPGVMEDFLNDLAFYRSL
ncbi:type III secretion system chaperone [Desulfospira joergensenii]|uniref:type III secretion system chaperone n=1 Tax=Desulfospira joergensenii TaxID=53329 RepID=UPI0003B64AE5|nr:type III secretion system chaperone [Desulfospira joergensenii]